jgi:hypothetical protein
MGPREKKIRVDEDRIHRKRQETECTQGNDENGENGDGSQARPLSSPAMQPLVQRRFKIPGSAPPFQPPQFLLEALVIDPFMRFAHSRSVPYEVTKLVAQ